MIEVRLLRPDDERKGFCSGNPFIDKNFGLCYLRVPTWAPFRPQCFNLFNEDDNCQMTEDGGQKTDDKDIRSRNFKGGTK